MVYSLVQYANLVLNEQDSTLFSSVVQYTTSVLMNELMVIKFIDIILHSGFSIDRFSMTRSISIDYFFGMSNNDGFIMLLY